MCQGNQIMSNILKVIWGCSDNLGPRSTPVNSQEYTNTCITFALISWILKGKVKVTVKNLPINPVKGIFSQETSYQCLWHWKPQNSVMKRKESSDRTISLFWTWTILVKNRSQRLEPLLPLWNYTDAGKSCTQWARLWSSTQPREASLVVLFLAYHTRASMTYSPLSVQRLPEFHRSGPTDPPSDITRTGEGKRKRKI